MSEKQINSFRKAIQEKKDASLALGELHTHFTDPSLIFDFSVDVAVELFDLLLNILQNQAFNSTTSDKIFEILKVFEQNSKLSRLLSLSENDEDESQSSKLKAYRFFELVSNSSLQSFFNLTLSFLISYISQPLTTSSLHNFHTICEILLYALDSRSLQRKKLSFLHALFSPSSLFLSNFSTLLVKFIETISSVESSKAHSLLLFIRLIHFLIFLGDFTFSKRKALLLLNVSNLEKQIQTKLTEKEKFTSCSCEFCKQAENSEKYLKNEIWDKQILKVLLELDVSKLPKEIQDKASEFSKGYDGFFVGILNKLFEILLSELKKENLTLPETVGKIEEEQKKDGVADEENENDKEEQEMVLEEKIQRLNEIVEMIHAVVVVGFEEKEENERNTISPNFVTVKNVVELLNVAANLYRVYWKKGEKDDPMVVFGGGVLPALKFSIEGNLSMLELVKSVWFYGNLEQKLDIQKAGLEEIGKFLVEFIENFLGMLKGDLKDEEEKEFLMSEFSDFVCAFLEFLKFFVAFGGVGVTVGNEIGTKEFLSSFWKKKYADVMIKAVYMLQHLVTFNPSIFSDSFFVLNEIFTVLGEGAQFEMYKVPFVVELVKGIVHKGNDVNCKRLSRIGVESIQKWGGGVVVIGIDKPKQDNQNTNNNNNRRRRKKQGNRK